MKVFYALLLAMFLPIAGFADVVHLNCEGRDVTVDFLEDGAMITVNGSRYAFRQEYDAPVSFYNPTPWMRVEIGNRNYSTKYTFAAMVNDMPTYMQCQEIE